MSNFDAQTGLVAAQDRSRRTKKEKRMGITYFPVMRTTRTVTRVFTAGLTAFAVLGCASNKFDPCREMVKEADEIRAVEKQIAKSETKIKKFRASGDTASLNSEMRRHDALKERKKFAQFTADNLRADCTPWSQDQPLDQTQYREERKYGK